MAIDLSAIVRFPPPDFCIQILQLLCWRVNYLLGNRMFSATSLELVVLMSLSWCFSPKGGMRNLAIWTSVSLSPPWEIRAYPSRTSPRYIMYSHQRSLSVSSMSCKEKKSVSFRNGQSSKYFSIHQHSLCCGPSSRNIR